MRRRQQDRGGANSLQYYTGAGGGYTLKAAPHITLAKKKFFYLKADLSRGNIRAIRVKQQASGAVALNWGGRGQATMSQCKMWRSGAP